MMKGQKSTLKLRNKTGKRLLLGGLATVGIALSGLWVNRTSQDEKASIWTQGSLSMLYEHALEQDRLCIMYVEDSADGLSNSNESSQLFRILREDFLLYNLTNHPEASNLLSFYNIQDLPALWLTDATGNRIKSIDLSAPAKDILAELDQVNQLREVPDGFRENCLKGPSKTQHFKL